MSGLATFAGWMIAFVVIPVLVAVFFFSVDDLAALLPSLPVIAAIESAIAAQPRVAAYLLAMLIVLIVISSWAVACVSNARYRKELSAEYRLKPLSSREFAEQNESRREASMEDRAALVKARDQAVMERGDAMRDWDA